MTGDQGQRMPGLQADYTPLSPLSFLARTVVMHPERLAVVHGAGDKIIRRTWLQLYARCASLASALAQEGIGMGSVVAIMMPNTIAMVESNFAIPMTGAASCILDPGLEPSVIAAMLDASRAQAILVDAEFAAAARCAIDLRKSGDPLLVIDVIDPVFEGAANPIGVIGYEEFLQQGDQAFAWHLPDNENDNLALGMSHAEDNLGTCLSCSHRGAAISALAAILEWDLPRYPVYLWTQAMYQGNGWSLPWAVAARAGVNVCLRDEQAACVPELLALHGVTHYCGPAAVHSHLSERLSGWSGSLSSGLKGMVAGDLPAAKTLRNLTQRGIALTHAYCMPKTCGLSVQEETLAG